MKKIAPKPLGMAGAAVSCKWRCMWKIPVIPIYYSNGPWWCCCLQLCIASLFITVHSLEMASLASPKHSLSFKLVKPVLRWRKGHCLEYYFHSWLLGKSQINWLAPFWENCLNYRAVWSHMPLDQMASSKYLLRSNQSLYFPDLFALSTFVSDRICFWTCTVQITY